LELKGRGRRVLDQVDEERTELSREFHKLKEQITRLQRERDLLQQSVLEKQILLDASIDTIRLVDKDMKILWANETTARNLGIPPEQVLGQTCYKLFTGRGRPCRGCPIRKAMESGRVEHAVIQKENVSGFEGETYWDCYGIPLKDETDQISRIIQITRNVTEKILAQKELN